MIKLILMLKRRRGMTHDEFTHYQRTVHRPLLLSIPETRRYMRRFVVSYPVPAPDGPEPEYDSMVEVWFDSTADLEALFGSDNFVEVIDPDHVNFIDLSSVGRLVCEEDVVIGHGAP
jgi:uncharacterized protein (TIGR02118 family)